MKIIRECFFAAPGGTIALAVLTFIDMAVIIR